MQPDDVSLFLALEEMGIRWLHYLEILFFGSVGGLATIAVRVAPNGDQYTGRQLVCYLFVGAIIAFVSMPLIPEFMADKSVYINVLCGILSYPIMQKLIANGTGWIARFVRGPGSPLDE